MCEKRLGDIVDMTSQLQIDMGYLAFAVWTWRHVWRIQFGDLLGLEILLRGSASLASGYKDRN